MSLAPETGDTRSSMMRTRYGRNSKRAFDDHGHGVDIKGVEATGVQLQAEAVDVSSASEAVFGGLASSETLTVVPRAVPREPARAVSSTAWTAASSSPTAAVTGVPSAAAPSVAMVTVKVT